MCIWSTLASLRAPKGVCSDSNPIADDEQRPGPGGFSEGISVSQLGRWPERFRIGSAAGFIDRPRTWGGRRKEYTLFRQEEPRNAGNSPIHAPHKNSLFRVIARATTGYSAVKTHFPYSTKPETHGTVAINELDLGQVPRDLSRHRMKRPSSRLPDNLAPVAVNLDQAAALIGIGSSLFTQLVAAGQMPEPRPIASRLLWDVEEVAAAFRAIPHRGESNGLGTSSPSNNPWN